LQTPGEKQFEQPVILQVKLLVLFVVPLVVLFFVVLVLVLFVVLVGVVFAQFAPELAIVYPERQFEHTFERVQV
jgi:hypothetical protein